MYHFYAQLKELQSWLMRNRKALLNQNQHHIISLFAVVTMTVVLWVNAIYWDVAHLGFFYDTPTGSIAEIAPDSSAAQANMQVGDRIVSMYNIPWQTFITRPSNVDVVLFPEPTTSIEVVRQNSIVKLLLDKHPPYSDLQFDFQLEKLTALVLALACWACGIVFGFVLRYESSWSIWFSTYWFLVSAILGTYIFASYLCLWLYILLQIVTPFIALWFIYLTAYYPRRLCNTYQDKKIKYLFLFSCALTVLIILTFYIRSESIIDFEAVLGLVNFIYAMTTLISCALMLGYIYKNEEVVNIRRKIRVIFFSTSSAVVLVSIITLSLYIFSGKDTNTMFAIDTNRLKTFILITVPLSYMIGAVISDLYYIDQLFIWIISHIIPLLFIILLVLVLKLVFGLEQQYSVLITLFCGVLLYTPILRIFYYAMNIAKSTVEPTVQVQKGVKQLSSTLDREELIHIVADAVTTSYRDVHWSYYQRLSMTDTEMLCVTKEHQNQNILFDESLLSKLEQEGTILNTYELARDNDSVPLFIEHAFTTGNPALWCPIMDTEQKLIAVFVIGNRQGMEPYRKNDVLLLQQLFNAASLAFNNSVNYYTLQESEAMIRELYRRVQDVQDETLRDISVELHDEILNFGMRLNVGALKNILSMPLSEDLKSEVAMILETEHAVIAAVRMICERIYPVGIDDPLGLIPILQTYIERTQKYWNGVCVLQVENTPIPLPPQIQRVAMRIVREAITNVTKHAFGSTKISVGITFPKLPPAHQSSNADAIEITIIDNGKTPVLPAKNTQLGLRNMIEGARSVGGHTDIAVQQHGGVQVRCVLPIHSHTGQAL